MWAHRGSGQVAGGFDRFGGYEATLRLLDTRPSVTANFATTDEQAIGALRACSERACACRRMSQLSVLIESGRLRS